MLSDESMATTEKAIVVRYIWARLKILLGSSQGFKDEVAARS